MSSNNDYGWILSSDLKFYKNIEGFEHAIKFERVAEDLVMIKVTYPQGPEDDPWTDDFIAYIPITLLKTFLDKETNT